MNVTLRARPGLVSLRRHHVYAVLRECIAASQRDDFRILHFSIQDNHLHLIVEASDRARLSAGMQAFASRTARRVNRALARQGKGALWSDRYHSRALETPREVRRAIVYVLMNSKKPHRSAAFDVDPRSSAAWFDGFRERVEPPPGRPPIRRPRTWLAAVGWRRHGLISIREAPRPASVGT